jgi:flagellin-like hook-associated protein FlgL
MRVTNTMTFNNAVSNMQKQHARLFEVQQQVAAGKTLQRPSDDPIGTRRVLDLRSTLAAVEQYKRNRHPITNLLQTTETSLNDVQTLVLRARSIALNAINDTVNADNRRLMATEVGSLFTHALQIGNTSVNGRYIFAGHTNTQPPFTATATTTNTASGFANSGTLTPLATADLIIDGEQIRATQVTDDTVSTSDNAASALALATAINEAFPTTGVKASASTTVSLSVSGFGDLSGANLLINGSAVTGTITDEATLVAVVNAANIPGVVAASAGTGNLTLTAADGRNIQIQSDGLATSNMSFTDFDLDGGVALDRTTTGVVTLVSDTPFTLGGLNPSAARFPGSASVNLTAQYRGDVHDSLMAVDTNQTLPVSVPGPQFLMSHLQPNIDRDTPLASLRQGAGISAGSLRITDRGGNTALIDLSTALTVGQAIDFISGAVGVNVTAAINAAGNGITVTDDNATPVQNLTISEVGTGSTASDLGILADRPGAVVGAPLNPLVTASTRLALLHAGRGVTLSSLRIANGTTEVEVDLRAATTVGEVLGALSSPSANVTAQINAAGTALAVRSNDSATVAVVTEVNGGTTVRDLGLQGSRDTLTTLSLLQEALQKDDRHALQHLLVSLDEGFEQVVNLRADVGVRTNRVTFVENQQQELGLHMRSLLAQTEEGDAIELFTRLSNLTVSFQAALAATARTVQPTLLDFLR